MRRLALLAFPALAIPAIPLARADGVIRLEPGLTALYEGASTRRQTAGGVTVEEAKRSVAVFLHAWQRAPGMLRLTVVRRVVADGDEDAAASSFDEMSVADATGTVGFRLTAVEEIGGPVIEVETQVPAAPLPDFASSTERREGEAEVLLMGSRKVKATFATWISRKGEATVIRRELSPTSRPQVQLDGVAAPLVEWKESFVVPAGAKLPARIEQRAALEAKSGGSVLRLETSLALDAKRIDAPSKEDAARVAAAHDALRSALDDFAALKDPDAIAKKVEAFAKLAAGTLLEMPAKALRERLDAYRANGIGKQAPDFTLESLDGEQVSFREATKGKAALLSFWGVNCGPCRKEAPFLTVFQEKYGARGFTVVAVNGYDESREDVKRFADAAKLKHLILLLGRRVASDLYSVGGYPTAVWIDAQGRVVAREVDFSPETVPLLERRIERMLAKK